MSCWQRTKRRTRKLKERVYLIFNEISFLFKADWFAYYICELLLNFTVDTTHRLCFYTVKSGKPSFDQLINLVIYVCIYRC